MADGHHSLLGHSVLHVHIGEFSVPIVATLKLCGLFGSFFVEMGTGFKLQARRLSLPGAAFRAVAPVAGDEDDRETFASTWM